MDALCILLGHMTAKDNPAYCLRCKKIRISYDEEDIEYED